jgi:amino acid adenylation domain-containing protein
MAKVDNMESRVPPLTAEQRTLLEQRLLARTANRGARTDNGDAGSGDAIPRLPRSSAQSFPLSFAQQRIWFLEQLNPGSASYNVPSAFFLKGPLRLDCLEASLAQVIRRHETLRTTFFAVDGEPQQRIAEQQAPYLELVDLAHVLVEQRYSEAVRMATEEARKPFDLVKGPLLRTSVYRLGDEEHLLLLVMHHIVTDGWSLQILFRDVGSEYGRLVTGTANQSPELSIQYFDFAIWQRKALETGQLEKQIAYWRRRLEGAPPVLQIPTDRARPAVQTFTGKIESDVLAPALARALDELSRHEGATLYMVLLAAFQILLWRYTAQTDIVVGSPIAGRNRSQLEDLIGCFINTLALRCDLSGEPTFRELLQRVMNTALEAYENQDVPFDRLVEELKPERELSHSPLFQAMLMLQSTPSAASKFHGLEVTPLEINSGTAKFDLTVCVIQRPEGLRVGINYNSDLFESAAVRRMLGHFRTLLEEITSHPGRRISQLNLLTEPERQLLLHTWNNSQVDYPRDRCIHELIGTQVEENPDRVAVTFEDSHLTYRELNQRANQLACHLTKLGVGPDVLVGLCLERSLNLVVGLLGILKAGGAYVPIDPSYPPDRIAFMLSDAGVKVLLTEQKLISNLPAGDAVSVCLDSEWTEMAYLDTGNPSPTATPENLAYVIYTSGSTGKPKGVQISHRAVVNFLCSMSKQPGLSKTDTMLAVTTLSFDIAGLEIYLPLISGARLVVASREVASDGSRLLECLEQSGTTVMQATPATWRMLVEAGWRGTRELKILCGGEALPAELAEALLARGSELWNMYGPTETTIWSAAHQLHSGEVLLGRPIANTQFYVLDSNQQLLPAGVPGELYIGGDGLARGYLHRPELTAEKFVANPITPQLSEQLYRTADLVRWLPDGSIDYLGRIDHQVKIRGFRIELGEIEAVLASHPQVEQGVVAAREYSPGDKRLVAYVVAAGSEPPNRGDLRKHLEDKLPDYMIPSAFVFLDKLPLTPNGKVDRKALPAPDQSSVETEHAYVAPRTPTEEVITGIWSDVLKLQRVGTQDDFFDLGGYSLLATQVIARIRQIFDVELPLRTMFESPTPAGLAEGVDAANRSGAHSHIPPLTTVSRDRDLPLSFAQERLWFLNQLEPEDSFYSLPWGMRIQGSLDLVALEASLREMVRRHEMLRTRFASSEDGPLQVVDPESHVALRIVDLICLPADSRQAEAKKQIAEEVRQPFDLARGPLMRACLWQLGADKHILLLNVHHIAADRRSMSVMADELSALYSAFVAGKPSPLPALKIQYADYSVWQRKWLQGEALGSQLAYWKQQLAGAPPRLELPTDQPRPAVQTFDGGSCALQFSKELSEALRLFSRREQVTLFMTLLAAYQVLLSRYSGQEDIIVGTPIANRRWAETDSLIGFFANTLALRADLSGDPSFRNLLSRVKQVALGAYAHQDLPFEKLVEELQPERSLSHNPLFQTVFALQESLLQPPHLPGLNLSRMPILSDRALFELSLFVAETPDGLMARLEYNRDLFAADTAGRILGQFEVLLNGIVKSPDRAVSDLPLMTEEEKHRVLLEWNDTRRPYPEESVSELFEAQVRRTPNAVALVFENRQLTYRELNGQANQLATQLRRRGVRVNTRVGICMERGLEMVIGLLGILKAGGAYVPVDGSYPQARLSFMLRDASVAVVVTREQWVASLPPEIVEPILVEIISDLDVSSDENKSSGAGPDDLAYVMYTSGSTGIPKGVEVPHRGIVRLLFEGGFARLDQNEVFLQLAPLSFDASTLEIWGALLHGGHCVLFPDRVPTTEALRDALRKHAVSTLWLTSSLFNSIIEDDPEALGTVRHVLTGGEALSVPHIRRALHALPNTQLTNAYGPTENTTFTTTYPIPREIPALATSIPIGRPIGNTQTYVLDRHMQPVPIGVSGELFVGGDGLARGYLNRTELTHEKFVANPFSPGSRLYRTGDLVRYLPNGTLDFQGRTDHQVKIRGFRIELGEIEASLRSHPDVRDAVAVVRENVPGAKCLVAYVASHMPQAELTVQLRSFLSEKLPDYMLPSVFVVLASLPMTESGKVNRHDLPLPQSTTEEEHYVGPRNPIEEVIAGIWAEILNLPRVGICDDFFQLGGHSLLATQVVSRIRRILNVELPLKAMFEMPTIATLGERIENAQHNSKEARLPPLVPAARDRDLPLSFAQQRLWFFSQLEPGSSFYNVPLAVRLTGHLDLEALEWSLNQVVARHEVLRTTFHVVSDKPVQVIAPEVHLPLPLTDLRSLPEAERETAATKYAKEEAHKGFDLTRGPLLRPSILRLGEQNHALFLTTHHIVSDAWSSGIMLRELGALYVARLEGMASPFQPLTVQYADYSVWQRELQGQIAEQGLAYWRKQLSGAPTLLVLPTDRPRPPAQSFRGAKHTVSIGKDLTEQLRHFSQREGATLFMVLLSGFQTLLAHYTKQDELLVGTDVANRTGVETEKLIGFFINLLPLRADLRGNPSFRELLARVREMALGAYAHQDVPFEKLVEEFRLERSPAYNPLVQVLFVMQNTPRFGLELPNLEVRPFPMPMERSKFDVAVFMSEDEQGLTAHWVYSTDLFDETTIQRMAARYQVLLTNVVERPETRVRMLEFLTEEEREQRSFEKKERKQSKLTKLKSVEAKAVSISAAANITDGSGRRR